MHFITDNEMAILH